MLTARALLAVFIASVCFSGVIAKWEYLRIKYGSWYHLPYTLSEIASAKESDFGKFEKAGYDSDLNVALYSYPNDPRFLIMFDKFGNIGGLRFCYVKADVGKGALAKNESFPFDYSKQVGQFYTEENYWNTPAWCNDVLVTSPAKLKGGGRKKLHGYPVEDLWLRIHGSWVQIPKEESKAEALGFTKQGCYYGMGQHYFLDMKEDRTCETLVPTTLLFKNGTLIGCNLPSFGAYTVGEKRWFESFTEDQVAAMAPFSNPCVLKWIFGYGTVSCHVSFLFDHTTVSCD